MFKLLFEVSLISLVFSESAIEINTKLSNDENSNINETTTQNNNTTLANAEVFALPNTQPSAQSQHIAKSVETVKNDSITKNTKTKDEFRPSPEFKEPTYERNLYPVKKAYPEAKFSNIRNNEYGKRPSAPWERPSENSWTSSATFKFPQNHIQTTKDKPYKFFDNYGRDFHSFSGKNDYEAGLTKHSNIPVSSSGSGSGVGGSWEVSGTLYPDSKYLPKKPNYGYDFGYVEKPSTDLGHHGGYEGSVKKYQNPWKKIIKIIAAFIPIGLLISALTPTIITVSPMNTTMMRSRNDDPHTETIRKLISSLGYFDNLKDKDCENRILCELLQSASSSHNAEKHIENFMSNFSDGATYSPERIEELKMIFEAVKETNVKPLFVRVSKIILENL
ncbi:hypothetical protein HHI36_011037 [Cryptolaemus montrouzieri]|uniref:Uncharacterized protein n=1 Tax=Cryptolaemus montrouzieri TaxID=559131 RepID=A0ABD2MKI7_9CUCU